MQLFLDYHSRTPIYIQIKEQIVLDVRRGILKPGEQLPSLRQLSAQLGLNINTVKRALQELEAEGITNSVAGKGIFISDQAQKNDLYLAQALDKAAAALRHAKELGADRAQLSALLDTLLKEDDR